jgi:hypothetical protein
MTDRIASAALIISVVSNLAVLAGLGFVAVQINQTNQSLAIQHQWSEKVAVNEWSSRVSENADLAALVAQVEAGTVPVSAGGEQQLRYWMGELTQIAFAQVNLFEAGVLTREQLDRRMIRYCHTANLPVFSKWVQRHRKLNPEGALWPYVDFCLEEYQPDVQASEP